jgi:hypothetical protein
VEVVIRWIIDKDHEMRRGHWPNWFELGAGQRECVECVFNRSGGPRGGRQQSRWALMPRRLDGLPALR